MSLKLRSAVTVVVVNGQDCIAHHSRKHGERQDPSLWEIFIFCLMTYFDLIPQLWYLWIRLSLEIDWISHLLSKAPLAISLSSISLQQPPNSPPSHSSHRQLLCFPYPRPFPKPDRGQLYVENGNIQTIDNLINIKHCQRKKRHQRCR